MNPPVVVGGSTERKFELSYSKVCWIGIHCTCCWMFRGIL